MGGTICIKEMYPLICKQFKLTIFGCKTLEIIHHHINTPTDRCSNTNHCAIYLQVQSSQSLPVCSTVAAESKSGARLDQRTSRCVSYGHSTAQRILSCRRQGDGVPCLEAVAPGSGFNFIKWNLSSGLVLGFKYPAQIEGDKLNWGWNHLEARQDAGTH